MTVSLAPHLHVMGGTDKLQVAGLKLDTGNSEMAFDTCLIGISFIRNKIHFR